MDWDKITIELSKKLDPANVKPAKSFGPKGDYIEGWHAIAEANRIFGFDGWSYSIKDVKCVSERPREIGKNKTPGFGVTYTAAIYVDVMGGVRREDVGAGHGYDVDCGLAHESAIKEAVTDALKRALRTFGNPFGLALYDKSRENVGIDLPPFDAAAAAARIKASIAKKSAPADLDGLYRAERDVIDEIRAADAAMHDELLASFKARKTELTQKDAAA